MDKYSVLMSVYYKENPQNLRESIDSILAQTVFPDEFVIVKDGPLGDEMDAIIDDYVREHEGLFKVISLPKNGGLAGALNEGIKVCSNELIARMDSDDISRPNRCELLLKAFEEDPELVICGTQIDEFIETTDNIVSSREVPCDPEELKIFARRRSPFNHPTVMYRKSVIEKRGGYKGYARKEDLELFCGMVMEGVKARNLPDHSLLYRTNNDNLQRRRTFVNCSEYIIVMYRFFRKKYISFSDMSYVFFGQLALYLLPLSLCRVISKKFLRKS